MIGLEKEPIARSVKRKKVVFYRFAPYTSLDGGTVLGGTGGENTALHTGGTLCLKTSVNCDLSGGGLGQGVGAELAYTSAGNTVTNLLPSTITNIFCVRLKSMDGTSVFERYLVAFEDGYVRLYNESSAAFSMGMPVGKNACGVFLRAVDGEERYLIVGDDGARFLMSDEEFYPTGRNDLTNVFCVCKNRLFILLQDGRLAYADPTLPWDLTESIDDGGYIELPIALGAPIALTAVGEYVYIVFRRALMRLTVKGGGRDFCLEEIFYSGGKIVSGSVCGLSDGVAFWAHDGLWRVKGTNAQRFGEGIALYISAQDIRCNAAVCGEKYLLRYADENGEFVSVAVDLDGKSWSYCYDLLGLSEGFDAPVFVRAGNLYQLGGTALPADASCAAESVDNVAAIGFCRRGKFRCKNLLRRAVYRAFRGVCMRKGDCGYKRARRELFLCV